MLDYNDDNALSNDDENYESCPDCEEARKIHNFSAAINCRNCKGRGIVFKKEKEICNFCGNSLHIDDSSGAYGLIRASISGGYSSSHLFDLTTYGFSLCEKCLREELFEKFKIKPSVYDYLDARMVPYSEDSAANAKRHGEKQKDSK